MFPNKKTFINAIFTIHTLKQALSYEMNNYLA